MASADEEPWGIDQTSRVYGLQVKEVQALFSTHDVVVRGSGLESLLADFAAQQIMLLKEPARTDKFTESAGPRIFELEVRRGGNRKSSE